MNVKGKVVYIILNKGAEIVKIGVTSNLTQRLTTLINSSGMELYIYYKTPPILNYLEIENACHDFFNEKRTFGEWFKIRPSEAKNKLKSLIDTFIYDPIYVLYKRGVSVNNIAGEYKITRQYVYDIIDGWTLSTKRKEECKQTDCLHNKIDITKCKRLNNGKYLHNGEEITVKYDKLSGCFVVV